MPITGGADVDHDQVGRRPGAHALLVAETDHDRRVGAATWVDRQLATGAKVYYKGWLGPGLAPDEHWIAGPRGALRAANALASGQLEFLDFPTVIERCGGRTEGLFALQTDEVRRALDEGWPRVAMSQESTGRPMADDAEAAEFVAQEAGYDRLARRWPLTTLCQLTLAEENAAAVWESTATHYHQIIDGQWTSVHSDGRWWLRGELDAHVVARFGAALHGALREARSSSNDADGPDLHIDLSEVGFVDLACAQSLVLATASAPDDQRVVLHGAGTFVTGLLERIGRPRTLTHSGENGGPRS